MYRAYEGANGWYVAAEADDGVHYAPSQWSSEAHMSEREARREARRRNEEEEE